MGIGDTEENPPRELTAGELAEGINIVPEDASLGAAQEMSDHIRDLEG
jgi:hypothetical protein